MRRMADSLVSWLLRLAPWYHEDEIEAREEHTEEVRRGSIRNRKRAERWFPVRRRQ